MESSSLLVTHSLTQTVNQSINQPINQSISKPSASFFLYLFVINLLNHSFIILHLSSLISCFTIQELGMSDAWQGSISQIAQLLEGSGPDWHCTLISAGFHLPLRLHTLMMPETHQSASPLRPTGRTCQHRVCIGYMYVTMLGTWWADGGSSVWRSSQLICEMIFRHNGKMHPIFDRNI